MGQGFLIRLKAGKPKVGEILIYESIGEGWFGDGMSAKRFAKELKDLGAVDEIEVRINSYGGEVFDGFAIYTQLVQHKAKIVVFIDGIAASIASVIAMAGSEIKIAEAATIMIHDAWGFAMGNARDLRDLADRLDMTSGAIADVYAARSKRAAGEIRDWMQAETWFTASEALKNGFATVVIDNMKIAALAAPKYDAARFGFRRPPARVAAPADHGAARIRFEEQRARMVRHSLARRAAS